MAVRFFAIPLEIVFVLMVFIVHMFMRVRHRMMNVFVHMLFCQVQPYAYGHESAGHQQRQSQRIAHEQRQHGAEEGCFRKIGPWAWIIVIQAAAGS